MRAVNTGPLLVAANSGSLSSDFFVDPKRDFIPPPKKTRVRDIGEMIEFNPIKRAAVQLARVERRLARYYKHLQNPARKIPTKYRSFELPEPTLPCAEPAPVPPPSFLRNDLISEMLNPQ